MRETLRKIVITLVLESGKSRFEQAQELLAGNVLWSAIEDATVDQPVSLLWFNPPFDRIRGAGRTELTLFNRVNEWPAHNTGLRLMNVLDDLLADEELGLPVRNQPVPQEATRGGRRPPPQPSELT